MSSCVSHCLSRRLENIDERAPASWLPSSCALPETPTESMEFLARSWSLSAMELSRALSSNHVAANLLEKSPFSSIGNIEAHDASSGASKESEIFLLHQALNSEFLSSQQLLKNGLYRSLLRGKAMGKWIKDQKERKKQEIRTHNAQLHAAVSVAGVAAAVAAIAASTASPEMSSAQQNTPSKTSTAMASAAALVASHCIEIAEEMGADPNNILKVVNSAINAKTNGDIMTLTAGAATALRGAAALRSRLQKGHGAAALALSEEMGEEREEVNILTALNFVSKGGELLKRTRKGDLHWKQVSFNINSNWQVVAKMKSKYMAGTFTKKKKCIVSGVYSDITAWPGREREDGSEQMAYFGIKTDDRVIEFECKSKADKQMWTEGIQHMLNCRANLTL
ncbi:VAN3-binding protein isoform X4 [Juglans microcarpa x Juglans regia]|uniref:VAN3-binding protein isoform X4 n=1 Tax=Juglans microcarpa x Juglans regia TaxID=2249226 RepID=UPI001B7ED5A0|nr:VAN3-binding protein isoform X4 [Juglans microcarpa x Juglans regia]